MSAVEISNRTQAMALFLAANPVQINAQAGIASITRTGVGTFVVVLDQLPEVPTFSPPRGNTGLICQLNGFTAALTVGAQIEPDGSITVVTRDATFTPIDAATLVHLEVVRYPQAS